MNLSSNYDKNFHKFSLFIHCTPFEWLNEKSLLYKSNIETDFLDNNFN